MSIADKLSSMATHLQDAYKALNDKGATIPAQKNMANLAEAILSIPGIAPPEPNSLGDLKAQLEAGTAAANFPIGTEIEDIWNGSSNPLIVGTYQTINGKSAVGLVRKFVAPNEQQFGNSATYTTSTIFTYLQGDYLNKCSDELKSVISESTVNYMAAYTGSLDQAKGKWHLLSGVEVYGTKNAGEGQAWEYWEQKAGVSAPTDHYCDGRVGYDASGKSVRYWLRSIYDKSDSSRVWTITDTTAMLPGALQGMKVTDKYGVLPFCYVIAD